MHLHSSIRAPGPLSIPRGSTEDRHTLMILFNPCPPLTGSPSRPIGPPRGPMKVFILLRCRIPLPSSILHLHDHERHPNHLRRLYHCTLNTCRHSCRWKPAITCTPSRANWKAKSHLPLGIGPTLLGRLVRVTDTVGDDPRRRSPGPIPPVYLHPCLPTSLARPHGDLRGVTPSASSPLHR